ncbi:GGDEF domain-containing protein [Thermobrachium celere]|uniref:GGDEF domain-containing protein n=1 Tax=Thermobrachium celere TaxID=53422 RepID=UPI0019430B4C|nr:GGDEF domain-containing protein [Thermobrachium celere]GFR34325.1 hypothetical protein TCEA9_01370 [Thermobrachium celere]
MKKIGFGALKVALYYFLFGICWVMLSDRILYSLVRDKNMILNFSIVKGSIFICISSILIYVLVKREIKRRMKMWEFYATHDAMTKCLNRRAGLEKLTSIINKYSKTPISIIYADLNNLKLINDSFGHCEGDKAIINASKIFRSCIKKDDFVIRLGGDEFLIVTLNCNEIDADNIVERINFKIDELNKMNKVELSVSFGIATYTKQYESVVDFIQEADRRMYENKKKFHSKLKYA